MDYIETLLFNNLFMRMQEHVKEPEDITLVSTQELGARGAEAHATLEKMKVELRSRALPVMASALGISEYRLESHIHGPVHNFLPRIVFNLAGVPLDDLEPGAGLNVGEGMSETWRFVSPQDQELLRALPFIKSAEFVNSLLQIEFDPALPGQPSVLSVPDTEIAEQVQAVTG